jgi:hypothetical protein
MRMCLPCHFCDAITVTYLRHLRSFVIVSIPAASHELLEGFRHAPVLSAQHTAKDDFNE